MHSGPVLHPVNDAWWAEIKNPPDPLKYQGGNGGLLIFVILWPCLFLLQFFGRFGPELRRNVKIPL